MSDQSKILARCYGTAAPGTDLIITHKIESFFTVKIMIGGETGYIKFHGGPEDAKQIAEAMAGLLPPPAKRLPDTELMDRLEALVKDKVCRLTFNSDHEDGYFCTYDPNYSYNDSNTVADLETSTKRNTLREAITAAIEYLERS